jgi:hypothetical protein
VIGLTNDTGQLLRLLSQNAVLVEVRISVIICTIYYARGARRRIFCDGDECSSNVSLFAEKAEIAGSSRKTFPSVVKESPRLVVSIEYPVSYKI